jgi:hypothetical protein
MGVKEDFYPQLLQALFVCHALARLSVIVCFSTFRWNIYLFDIVEQTKCGPLSLIFHLYLKKHLCC